MTYTNRTDSQAYRERLEELNKEFDLVNKQLGLITNLKVEITSLALDKPISRHLEVVYFTNRDGDIEEEELNKLNTPNKIKQYAIDKLELLGWIDQQRGINTNVTFEVGSDAIYRVYTEQKLNADMTITLAFKREKVQYKIYACKNEEIFAETTEAYDEYSDEQMFTGYSFELAKQLDWALVYDSAEEKVVSD